MPEKAVQLLGPGGQQEIAAGVCKKLCRVCGRLKDHAPRRKRAFGPQQAVVFDAGGFTRRPDVFGGVHRIGMGGVHAEGGPLQQGGHFLRRQPPAVDRDTLQTALLFGSQRGRYADEDFGPLRGQLAGEQTALGGAAEHDDLHARYPRGVTICPPNCRVAVLPMKTVVNISTGAVSSSARVRMRWACLSRPMFRTSPQTVCGGFAVVQQDADGSGQIVRPALGRRIVQCDAEIAHALLPPAAAR